jgi:ABC-2 type transport system permease protein
MEKGREEILRGGRLIMKTIFRLIELFFWNSKLRIARSMEYRFNFIAGTIISLFFSFIGPVVQYLIFTQTKGYPGWTIKQLILFQGMMLFWMGLRDTAFGDLKQNITEMVQKGDFDRLLLKPYPPIGVILTSGFNFRNFGTLVTGIIITILAAGALKLTLGWGVISLIILTVIFGLLFNMTLDILFCSVIVLIIHTIRLGEFFENLLNFARYPVEIFSKAVRFAFLTFVPFAIWIYYPTQVLLQRIDLKIMIAFATSLIMFGLSLIIWKHCLKKYTSAGG